MDLTDRELELQQAAEFGRALAIEACAPVIKRYKAAMRCADLVESLAAEDRRRSRPALRLIRGGLDAEAS